MSAGVRPEDVLPDGADAATFGGLTVRKGSVAAFVANARLLEVTEPGSPTWDDVVAELRALVPAIAAAGVLDVFELRSPTLREVCGLT